MAPLHMRAAWVRLSLHVGGRDAAHQTADKAAEETPAHSWPVTAADMAWRRFRHTAGKDFVHDLSQNGYGS